MTAILAGFVLLTLPCKDCLPIPVTETLYNSEEYQ